MKDKKYLMEVCRNWGSEGCRSDISKWKSIKEDKEGIELYPLKQKVDEICRNCKSLSLNGCPECGSKNVVEMIRFETNKDKKMTTFVCENCDFVLQKPA